MKAELRTSAIFLLALIGIVPNGSQPQNRRVVSLGQEFTIKVREEVCVEREGLFISFASVPSDSRCPEGVNCVWEGNAEVALALRSPKKKATPIVLNTTSEPREAVYGAYRIRLLGLTPNRKSDSPIDPSRYSAALIVTK